MASLWNRICRVFRWRPSKDAISGLQLWLLAKIMSLTFAYLILRKDGTVNTRLVTTLSKLNRVPAKRKAVNGVYTVDITIDKATGVWCRLFVPSWETDSSSSSNEHQKSKKLPLMMTWHGGGFAFFSPDGKEYDILGRSLSKNCQAVVILFSYRKAPEHKYPTAFDDGLTGFEWVREQTRAAHEDFPIDVVDFDRVFLVGDSAGANIVHHLAAKVGKIDVSPMSITGLILLMPFFGGEERTASEVRFARGQMLELIHTDWMWRSFLPPGSDRDHPACNVCGPTALPFGPMSLPRMLVVVGGKDPLMDRQLQYVEAMRSAGKDCKLVVYENSFHGFYFFGNLAKAMNLLHDDIKQFVNAPGPANETETVVSSGY